MIAAFLVSVLLVLGAGMRWREAPPTDPAQCTLCATMLQVVHHQLEAKVSEKNPADPHEICQRISRRDKVWGTLRLKHRQNGIVGSFQKDQP